MKLYSYEFSIPRNHSFTELSPKCHILAISGTSQIRNGARYGAMVYIKYIYKKVYILIKFININEELIDKKMTTNHPTIEIFRIIIFN